VTIVDMLGAKTRLSRPVEAVESGVDAEIRHRSPRAGTRKSLAGSQPPDLQTVSQRAL
jgi:hypothetical protein